jgi:hypothetical protein
MQCTCHLPEKYDVNFSDMVENFLEVFMDGFLLVVRPLVFVILHALWDLYAVVWLVGKAIPRHRINLVLNVMQGR